MEYEEYMSRIRDPYVRFCERDEANASPYSILCEQPKYNFCLIAFFAVSVILVSKILHVATFKLQIFHILT